MIASASRFARSATAGTTRGATASAAVCGKTAPVAVRARDGRPDICVNCYRLPEAICSKCQRRRPCNFAATSQPGLPLVLAAGHRRLRALRPGPPAAGPLARGAGLRPVLHRRAAPPRAVRVLRPGSGGWSPRPARPLTPARTAPGSRSPTPAPIAGIEDKLYEKGRCARCSLRRRARELLSAGTGTIPRQLTGVLEAITAAQPAAQRAELAAQGRRRRPARRRRRRPADHQPRGAGCPSAPASRRLPAAHAHRGRRATASRRGTRPRRTVARQPPGRDRAGRRPAAGAVLRHLAGDAPPARQRPARPGTHPHRACPQQHPRRRGLAGLAPQPRHRAWQLRAGRHRPLATHRALGLPGAGLPDLGRLPRALPAPGPPRPRAGHRRRHQPGPTLGPS